MHTHQHAPAAFRVERSRLDVRVDLRPLLRPVVADLLVPADEAALERPRPRDIRGHGGEGGVDVACVERGIRRAEQLDFRGWSVWHECSSRYIPTPPSSSTQFGE